MCSQRGPHALALQADLVRLASQQTQGRQFSGQLFRMQIEAQRGLQRREGHFIRPQGALKRMALQTRDQRFFTDDNSRLRAAQQFIAGEAHQADAGGNHLLRHRLFRQAVLA